MMMMLLFVLLLLLLLLAEVGAAIVVVKVTKKSLEKFARRVSIAILDFSRVRTDADADAAVFGFLLVLLCSSVLLWSA